MTITLTAADIWRDYEISGVPASGENEPDKRQVRAWGALLESLGVAGGGPGLGYSTLALLNADLVHAEGTLAIVFTDATPANNGLYKKIGASGIGSWSRIGDLPNGIVRLTVTGGTGDAIVASASETPSVPGAKLYLMTPGAANTTSTFITVNGGSSVEIKNAFGVSLAANSLLNGSQVLMAWSVDHYQLLISANVDASAVLAAAVAAETAAAASATAAAASASALGNQAYTFDTYALAQAATVPVGVKSLRLMGYYAAGDAPVASYFRVASQPSTANKVRTTDRFLPNGSTDSTNGGWWQMVLDEITDARKFGYKADGATDMTSILQGAVTAGDIVVTPSASNGILSGDILFPSGRTFHLCSGATIINTGGRFTAAAAGIHDVALRIDGVIGFLATNTAAGMLDWPDTVPGGTHRGLIEMGGTVASPGTHLSVTGKGRVYSDYVWAGIPSGLTNLTFQMNRKGISLINVAHCLVEGLEVDHHYGEAVYTNSSTGAAEDVKFMRLFAHDNAFDSINFNMSLGSQGFEIAHCRVINSFSGVEASCGNVHDNFFENCFNGMRFGGGAGVGPIKVTGNMAQSCTTGFDLEFSSGSPTANILIEGNSATSCGTNSFVLNSVRDFQFIDNRSYNHATASAGVAFNIGSDCARGYLTGNTTAVPGAHSTGTFVNSAGGAVTLGTNPAV